MENTVLGKTHAASQRDWGSGAASEGPGGLTGNSASEPPLVITQRWAQNVGTHLRGGQRCQRDNGTGGDLVVPPAPSRCSETAAVPSSCRCAPRGLPGGPALHKHLNVSRDKDGGRRPSSQLPGLSRRSPSCRVLLGWRSQSRLLGQEQGAARGPWAVKRGSVGLPSLPQRDSGDAPPATTDGFQPVPPARPGRFWGFTALGVDAAFGISWGMTRRREDLVTHVLQR